MDEQNVSGTVTNSVETNAMKISVMTLTNRYGGIDIMWANLKRQTEQDFEWVLVDGLWEEREEEVKAYVNDPRLKYIRQGKKVEGLHTYLAHADNEGFRNCEGELIVCVQDYIWIPHDSLEKYWFHHQNNPQGLLVTGVGDQYSRPTKEDMNDPHGKITVFEKPYTRRPEVKGWSDPRKRSDLGTFYEVYPQDWELNYCSIPKKIILELGGMDEEYDAHGFAWDNVNIAQRAALLGYKVFIDQTNECMGFDHDGWWPNPLKVNRVSPGAFHHQRMKDIVEGRFPLKLPYLG